MWSIIKFFLGYWTFLVGLLVGYYPGRIVGLLIGCLVGNKSPVSKQSVPCSTDVPPQKIDNVNSLASVLDKENQKTTYLLDGSNILHWEEETRGLSLDILCSITDYLKSKRKEFFVLFDATAPYRLKKYNKADLERLNILLKTDPSHFRIIPGGTRADEYLLEEARRDPHAIILTNDRYRDHFEKYPDVLSSERRCVQHGMIMKNGDICFLDINLSIPIARGKRSCSENKEPFEKKHFNSSADKTNSFSICPKCNCQFGNDEAFCSECGTKLIKKVLCLTCGKELKPDGEFCAFCGAKRNTTKT